MLISLGTAALSRLLTFGGLRSHDREPDGEAQAPWTSGEHLFFLQLDFGDTAIGSVQSLSQYIGSGFHLNFLSHLIQRLCGEYGPLFELSK